MMGRGEPCGTFCSPTKCWVGQVPVDVPHEVEIQRQVQVPVPVTRQVFVDVPTPVDQPFEQLVHSTRDVHVPVPRTVFLAVGQIGYRAISNTGT